VNDFFITGVAVLAGLCLFAAVHHLWIGWHRPQQKVHLLFGLLCLVAVAYVLAKLGTYRANSAQELVVMRGLVVACAAVFLGVFPWFVAEYTGESRRMPLVVLGAMAVFFFAANFILPYGLYYAELPRLEHITLPWGETVTDLRMHKPNSWFYAALAFFLLSFLYAGYACARQYLHGNRDRARSLGLAIAVFFVLALFNQAVNFGGLNFVHTAEFGFVALILLMNWSLSQELHQGEDRLKASERRFRSLVEQSPFSIQVLAPDGKTLQVNRAWEDLWGISGQALANYNILEDRQLAEKGLLPYMQRGFAGETLELPPVVYNPKQTPELPNAPFNDRWVRAYVYPIKDEAQRVHEVILMHEDITERKRTEDAIRNIAAGVSARTGDDFFRVLVSHLATLFDADHAFVGVLDAQDRNTVNTHAVYADGKIADNFSYLIDDTPCADVMRQGTCVYPDNVQRLFPKDRLLAEMACEGYIGTPLFDAQNHAVGLVVVMSKKPLARTVNMREILEIFAARAGAELQRLHAEERIRQIAYRDYLTGLANRASLHEYLSGLLERSRQSGRYSAMLLIDLDHFKTINDALSHQIGDMVLCEIAQRLTRVADGKAFVARLGGDEFVLLAPEITDHAAAAENHARLLAEAVVAALEKPITTGGQLLKVDASIGVALFPQAAADEHEILKHADIALYRAKSLGRGSIQFFLADMQASVSERLEVEKSLRHALANDGLLLHLQPQIDRDGRIVGAEALLRCRQADGTLIAPEKFISVAEETGLIHPVGQWVLARACAYLNSWANNASTSALHLSVNVSSWQFVRDDFVALVEQHLKHGCARHAQLMLEITESALFYDIEDAIEKMHALKALGLRLALDDFGTGYSSLSYLKKLPLDELKIDRSFIQAVSAQTPDVFIESIIAIGHAMGMSIIAEGVETAEQRDALAMMGCDGYQGYLWSQPLLEEAFVERVAAQKETA
jgi:diguanylate cyclase (GGDEF)-like protein/PAS domain S-box-containing protein